MKQLINHLLGTFGYQITRTEAAMGYSEEELELRRLGEAEDFTITTSQLPGYELTFASNKIFSILYREIFVDERYRFTSKKRSPLILDCGANIGLMTLYSKTVFPDARIIAFEPHPETFERLESNIASSGFSGITTIQKAIWTKDEAIHFLEDPQSTAGKLAPRLAQTARAQRASEQGSILQGIKDQDADTQGTGSLTVQGVSLLPYLTEEIDFLKIDIEGAEYDVLTQISDKLDLVKNVFVEYHSYVGKPQQLGNVISILQDAGFRIFTQTGGPDRDHPFQDDNTHKNMDLFVDVFGTRP